MKKLYLLISILSFTITVSAQEKSKPLKELQRELKEAKSDTAKVRIMVDLGFYYANDSYKKGREKSRDTAFTYAHKSESFSKRIKYDTGLANAYHLYAGIYAVQEKYEQAVGYSQKAVDLLIKAKAPKEQLWEIYHGYFMSYRYLNSIPKSVEVAKKQLEIAKESGDDKLIGKSYEDLAESYQMTLDYTEIIKLLELSLKHYKLGKEEKVQSVYSFMSSAYTIMGEHDKALDAALKAIKIIEKFKIDDYYNMTIYNSVGIIYRDMGKLDEAAKYFLKSKELSKKYDDIGYTILIARNLATVYVKAKKYDEAKKYLNELEEKYNLGESPVREMGLLCLLENYSVLKDVKKADKYFKPALDMLTTMPEHPAIGQLYFALAKYYYLKQDYTKSKENILVFKSWADNVKSKSKMEDTYNLLFKIDSAKGNYPEALKNSRIAALYKDSIFNEAKNRQIAELEIQYNVEQKDKDNLLLKQKGELQETKLSKATTVKNLSLASVVLLAIIIGLIIRQYNINQKRRKETNEKNIALQELLNEKEWLLKEIHHRVKNNLQIVMSLLNTQSHFLTDDAAKLAIKNSQQRIHSMSLIHKKLYENDNIQSVNMDTYIRELIEYFKMSFDTQRRIEFILNIEPIELNSSQAVPVGLILNEAISNAIKHAFPDNRQGRIMISLLNIPDNRIQLTIKDDGVSAEGNLNEKDFESLGIKMIKGFSRELNGTINFICENGLTVCLEFTNTMKL